jgi:hypothetical protein
MMKEIQVQIQQNCVVLWLPNMRDMRVSTNAKGENSRSAPQQHCQKWQASELFWKLRKVHFGKDYPHKKRTGKIHHLNNGKIHYFYGHFQ